MDNQETFASVVIIDLSTITPNKYQLPRIEDIFQDMKEANFFTKLDLRQGYHQIPISETDEYKTAFWGADRQLYEWNIVPYGLKNAPLFFQRTMDQILTRLRNSRYYINGISNWSNTFEDHLQHLRQVFHRLRQFKLKCHPRKCLFFADEMDF